MSFENQTAVVTGAAMGLGVESDGTISGLPDLIVLPAAGEGIR